jgi:hypothetical protein
MANEQDVTTARDIAAEQTQGPEDKSVTANQEHIAVLELGSGVWHEWRKTIRT